MRPRRMRRVVFTVLGTSILVSGAVIAAHEARAYEPGCVSQFWMLGLRGTTRTLCDGPIQPDGSWLRARQFYAAQRYVPMTCSWGTWGGSCYGGYWLDELDSRETYPVTPQTVLPDEPGHIPEGTVA